MTLKLHHLVMSFRESRIQDPGDRLMASGGVFVLQIDFHAAFDAAVSSNHMVIDDFTDLLTSDSPSQQRSY